MKKLNFIIGIILLCTTVAFSQTASLTIASLKAQVGDTVDVPITASNLSNVGAISLAISYDSSILQYVGIENAAVAFSDNATNNQILLGWFDNTANTPLNISSGKLVDLRFVVLSNAQVNLNFITNKCELSDENGNAVTSQLTNGAVNNVTGASLSLADVQGKVGDTVDVPITADNLSNVGAVSIKISYNGSILTFAGIQNAAVALTDNSTSGVISLGWFDNTAKTPLNLSSGKLVDLRFVVNSLTTDYLNFMTAQCDLSDETGNSVSVLYNNGAVNLVSTSSTTLKMEKVIAAPGNVVVPVKVYSFNDVGAISLKINYNSSVLTFDSLTNAPAGVSFTTNASGGVISIGWFDNTAKSPINLDSVALFDLNFSYTGGQSNLTFDVSKCDISNDTGTSITGVNYINGSVSAQTGTSPTFQLENVIAVPNSQVKIPLKVRDLKHIGAISLQISYNKTMLTFDSVSNSVNGINITANASEGILSLSWFDQTGKKNLNFDSADVADLNFQYTAGSSNLSFLTNKSEIADSAGDIIQTTVYINGSIKASLKPYFTLAMPADTMVNGFDTLKFQYKAVDPDGGTIKYAVLKPANASIDSTTGMFSYPTVNPLKDSTVVIVVSASNANYTVYDTTTLSIITGIKTLPGLPTAYTLSQNYPNPFNPSTSIDFTIPKESQVVLKIYNMLGQVVATLVNKDMRAGSYTYQFNANYLASGVYIYRLQAGDYTFTRKMTLLK